MNPGATHFFRFLVYLFLALYTAESQSLLVAAIFPLFVAALAIASFANGLWMVSTFLQSLPPRYAPDYESDLLFARCDIAVQHGLLHPHDVAAAILVLLGPLDREFPERLLSPSSRSCCRTKLNRTGFLRALQDYQTYSFNLLVKNDFTGRTLACRTIQGVCSCPIPSSLTPQQCALTGDDVVRVRVFSIYNRRRYLTTGFLRSSLQDLNISGTEGFSVGILVLILVVYRVLFYVALRLRK